MKLTDIIISAIIKKGILCEARNLDVEFDIPTDQLAQPKEETIFKKTTVHVKVDHVTVKFGKEEA